MLLSSLSFSLVNICVKLLANNNNILPDLQSYPVHELVLFRSIISLSICIAIIKMKGIPFWGNNKKWLILRGIFGVTSLTMFFVTLQNLPIAIATVIQYMSPVFTVIIAIYLLKEKVHIIQWFFFAIAMVGVYFIGYELSSLKEVDSITEDLNLIWLFVGIGSAFISGFAYNSIMKCRTTDEPITIVMYFPLIATPIMIIACFIYGFIVPKGIEWVLLLAIGILTQIAQITMTRAFHADRAARITPVKYIGAIYAVLIGFFIFNETIGFYSSIGIVFILLGVLLNTFMRQRSIRAYIKK